MRLFGLIAPVPEKRTAEWCDVLMKKKPGRCMPELFRMADQDNVPFGRNPFDVVVEIFHESIDIRRVFLVAVPALQRSGLGNGENLCQYSTREA